jgi:hypothetical protein
MSHDIILILRTYLHFNIMNVGFEFLTAVTIKTTVFWDITPCCLVDAYLLLTFSFFILELFVINKLN